MSEFPTLSLVVHGDASASGTQPVAEQISLFQHAIAVIGYHGAGLSNCLWMSPGSGEACRRMYSNAVILPPTFALPTSPLPQTTTPHPIPSHALNSCCRIPVEAVAAHRICRDVGRAGPGLLAGAGD